MFETEKRTETQGVVKLVLFKLLLLSVGHNNG